MRRRRMGKGIWWKGALCLIVLLAVSFPASAASRIAVEVITNGTIAPGLPSPPLCNPIRHEINSTSWPYEGVRNNTERVGGFIVAAGGGYSSGTYGCENLALGSGSGSVSGTYNNSLGANGGVGSVRCSYSYLRVGLLWRLATSCSLTTGPLAGLTISGPCYFAMEPTNAPMTAFLLTGVCTFGS